jgi:hypothetical protein
MIDLPDRQTEITGEPSCLPPTRTPPHKRHQAASRKFDQLDRKRAGTLTRAQIGRIRLTRKEFAAADPDNDGTLSKDEYLAVVEKRFNAADVDHTGKLTLQQFNSRAGLPLRRLTY